jgi:hypothetical protein
MMRRKDIIELAALLDGELDSRRAEELYAVMRADPGLRAEYEMQREAKLALSKLSRAEAPAYMATRIMGEIAAGHNVIRGQQSAWRWRTLAAAAGGFALCLVLVTGVLYVNTQRQAGYGPEPITTLGGRPLGLMESDEAPGAAQPQDYWSEPSIPAGTSDETADFLRFASEAHNYSRMTSSAESHKPDLTPAIQVLDGKMVEIIDGKVYIYEENKAEEAEGQE